MFDTHTHTNNSPDSKQTIDELCEAAIKKGVKGLAVTDHAHLSHIYENYFEGYTAIEAIKNSIADINNAKKKYKDKLQVFCGVEIGETLYDMKKTEQILELADYDIIIASIHHIKGSKWDIPYSRVKYDDSVSDEEIIEVLNSYFEELLEVVEKLDFDVLAHLTGPFRYINGRWNRNIDINIFNHYITMILDTIIMRGIALEINSAYDDDFYPNEAIIKKYYDLGGRLITLGSDAHRSERVANKFEEAITMLKKIGFSYYCYYEHRKPKNVFIY